MSYSLDGAARREQRRDDCAARRQLRHDLSRAAQLSPRAHAARRRRSSARVIMPGRALQREPGDRGRDRADVLPQRARRVLVRRGRRADGRRAGRRAERVEHQPRRPRRDRERHTAALGRNEPPRRLSGARSSAGSTWDPPSSCCSRRAPCVGMPGSRTGVEVAMGSAIGTVATDRGSSTRGTRMTSRPSASLAALRRRAEILERIRAFFAARGVLEVETPALSPAGVPDLALESVTAHARSLGPAAIPADVARVRDEAAARHGHRRHLSTLPRVSRRRARPLASARVHDARVVSRRLGRRSG